MPSLRKSFAVAALAVVAVLVACSTSPEARAAATSDDVFRTLPPQAEAVFGIDLATAKTSRLYDETQSWFSFQTSDLDRWATETGFNPRHDIDSVTAAMWGEPGADSILFLVRGRFELSPKLRSELTELGSHRGIPIYGSPNADSSSTYESLTFAILERGVAAVGPQPEVVNAIERRLAGGGPSLMDNAALTSRAREADGMGQLWLVSDQPGALTRTLPGGGDPRQQRILQILGAMRDATAALDVLSGLRFSFAGTAGTVEDASTLAEVARGLLALARISLPPEEQDMMQYLDRIRIDSRADRFEASINLDPMQIDQLLEKVQGRTQPEAAE